jgi:quercetin dioxygenase-like cupin family protein
MEIFRSSEWLADATGTPSTFSGAATVRLVQDWTVDDAEKLHTVVCAAGSRSMWHTHGAGQVLIVVRGIGLVGASDRETAEVTVGDMIVSDADERHWHGAADQAGCAFVSISRGTTTWL